MPLDLPPVELGAIAPELTLTIAAFVVLIVDAFLGDRQDRWYLPVLSSLGLVAAIIAALAVREENRFELAGMVVVDGFAVFIEITLAAFGLLTVWLARDYLKQSEMDQSEFYGLVLFSLAGMMLMASAADLIVMFLALEMFSIAIYVLVGFRKTSILSQESAMKYFLLGAFSSAFFLLGIALAYGAAGSTNLYGQSGGPDARPGLFEFLQTSPTDDLSLLILAVGFLIIGLGFKVAAVPFHMWTPDAYQGAPSPVTGFMAAGTKVAAFAAIIRLLDATLFSLRADWRPLVIAIAIVTMVVGSVVAIVQDDIKRLLAYSSIAHAGFVMTAIVAANDRGVSGSLFYLATYGISVLGAFAVVSALAGQDERHVRLADYKGLFYEKPLIAGALTIFLLSLAGVPLTAGFVGKLVVFGAAVDAGYAWLVVIGVIASLVATFFYLRVLVVMYMQEPEGERQPSHAQPFASGVIALTCAATVALGLFWGPLINLAEDATLIAGG